MSLLSRIERAIGLEKKRRSKAKPRARRKKKTPPRKANGEFRRRKKG